jgi:hypothetical protein
VGLGLARPVQHHHHHTSFPAGTITPNH